MTGEPRENAGSGVQGGVGSTRATSTLGNAAASGSSATSPLRWVFVIVPLVVIAAVGTNIMGLWTTSFQQAAREERSKQVELRPLDDEVVGKPLPKAPGAPEESRAGSEARFDAAVVLALLAKAKPEDGAAVFRICRACHASEKDAPPRLATSLWGIVGQRKAAHPEYRYSAALKAKGGTWSYRELAEYINDPRKFAPGTSMAFVGIADNNRIANLLAYMRTLSDNPAPLPN